MMESNGLGDSASASRKVRVLLDTDANNEIKKTDSSEDLQKNAEIDIQELTDQYINKVDKILNVKENEILTL